MRKLIHVTITLTAFTASSGTLAAPAGPVQGERILRAECSAYSEAGMNECLKKVASTSQRNLTRAEARALASITKWDEENEYIERARNALIKSNETFARYRGTECAFAASLSGGAIPLAPDPRDLACQAELNNIRAAQLTDFISDMPLK